MASDWQEETISVAGLDTQVFSGGSGEPLLVLHGAGGNPGWMPYCEALAAHFRVIAPSHPGFGASDRPDWMERVHDLAYFYRWFMEEQAARPAAGGWLFHGRLAGGGNVRHVPGPPQPHGAGRRCGHEAPRL